MVKLGSLVFRFAGQAHAQAAEAVFVGLGEDDGGVGFAAAQLLQLAQIVDEAKGTHLAESLAAEQSGGQVRASASAMKVAQTAASAMERSRRQSREVVRPR